MSILMITKKTLIFYPNKHSGKISYFCAFKYLTNMCLSSPRIYLTLCVIAFLHGQVLTQSNCHVIVNASKSIICPNENVELSAANIVDSIWQNIYQIPGESANGHFGFETVLSDNGLILAVGEPVSSINGTNSGRVRTFKKIFAENNEYWLEIGQLLGETGELCGWSIDLSADGLTMVVGCPGIFSDIGKVKVYKLIDYQWILKGSIIESNFTGGCFSKSVSINGNGNLIAFGGDCSPMVYTYMFQNNVWSLLGNPISVSGRSIELDSSGSRLVIGIESESQAFEGEYVKVYDFINNQWLETHEFNYASNQFSGPVVDMNSSGKIISIAYLFSSNSNGNNNGLVRIFEEMDGIWQQIGNDIIGENQEALGSAISLSNDGKKIALGSRYLINEGGNLDYRGKVATYIFENSNWNLFGGIILGDLPDDGNGLQPFRMTLVPAFSGDGNSLAVGIPGRDFNGINSGLVKIYTLNVPETQYYWSTGETISSIFVSPTETTTYNVTVTQGNQTCTSEVTINVNQPSAISENITACNTYTWNGNTYTQTGTYTWTGTNAAGCDSTVTLDLTILIESESVIEIFACEDYFWNDSLYTRSGTYTIVNNCASQTLILHLNEPQEIYEFIPLGSSYNFSGESLSASGVFYDTIPRAGLCDSVIRLNLFVNNDIACNINYETPNTCIFNSLELSTTNIKPKIYTIKTEIKDYEWFSASILFSVLVEGAPEQGIQAGILFSNELNPNWQNRIANPEWWGYNGKFFIPLNTDSLNLDYTDTYYYRAYLIYGEDTVLAQNTQQFLFFNGEQFNQTLDYGIVSDVNGNNYKTINIGSQKWMAEDLITNLFSNGDSLYNSITQYFPESGNGLYSHAIVDDERNVCPVGMHVPNDSDWSTLFQSTLNNDNFNKTSALLSNVYEIDSIWPFYNPKLNSTGLAILLENNFASYYWSSTFDYSLTDGTDNVYNFYRSTLIGRNDATVAFGQTLPNALNRIRCVGNNSISGNQFPTIFSTQVSDITNNSVKVGVELLNPNNAELIDKGIIVSTYTSLNGLSFGILPSTDDTPFPLLDDFKVFKLFSDSDGVNLNIDNLLPNMKYYVRAYVKNRFGVVYGEELSFTTLNNSTLWSTGETTTSITVSPTETTTYSVTITQGNQTCTSEVTINVNQPSAVSETVSACNSYTWNGNTYTQSGTYTWTGTNAAGCDSVVTLNLTITPQPEQPQLACWQTATFNSESCSWVISGTQPTEPTNLACYESAVFNSNICEWEIIGTQPANWYLGGGSVPPPPLPCNASFFFNDVTCEWEVTGTPAPAIVTNASACVSYTWEANGQTYTASGNYSFSSNCQDYTLNLIIAAQPPQPPTACYQTATFNSQICSWVLTGTQPAQPTNLACWQTANFNTTTCSWDVTGTQPALPTGLACYETANFNSQTCSWDVTGTQPAQPTNLACWQSANFNTTTCSWNVTGTQPTQPTNLACWQTANFNTTTCSWNVTGTQPAEPTNLACWQTANFNTTTCSWDVSGTQPTEPTNLACWQTANFNTTTCAWDVTGTQPAEPSNLACWQSANFNATTCSWDVTGTQPQQPTNLACWQAANFNSQTCAWEVSGTPAPAIVTNASACVNYTWAANGETYNTSGQYTFNNNCQDYTLNLTINQPSSETINASITEGETYSFNGQNLTSSGTYTDTLQTAIGCDSVVTLNLDVIPNIDPLSCNLIASQIEVCAETPVDLNIVIEGIQNICNKFDLPENLQAGLQGFFPFCENANDLSGNGNNAQINGAILSTDRFGNDNSAFYFDGENDYLIVETDATSSLSNLTALTISCWVKFDASNSLLDQGFVTKWNQSGFCGNEIAPSYWLGYHGADNRFIGATSNNGNPFTCVGTNGNTMTDWHHLVYTHNEEGENFYYDGVLAAQAPFNQLFCTTENPLIIGADINFGAVFRHFKGNIDDIFIYNRSLSQPEVNQLYGNSNSILWSTGETTPSITVSPTETTTYSVTVTQGNQTCTSEVTITVNQPTSETVNATITEGESYSFNGQSLTTAGTYTATLQNDAGCDSTVTLNLSVVPAPPAGCYAATVVDFSQGLNSVGLPVEPARSHAIFALGAPEAVVDGIVNFVSLGFGGSITLAFEAPVANGAGADIRIDEATWGVNPCNRYPETADVFASQDGINFVYLGRGCQDMSLDLGPLSWAQYIRITDVSDILSFRAGSDGYDVNGIECLNGTASITGDDGLVACSLQEVVSYTPGNRKNGTPVVASRSNPSNALGTPQNNNTINFTALGFGGTLVAKFDYVIFNQPGNDLRITETSFGNPTCANYPEKARISMSLDNLNWVDLGEICQDGEVDLGTLPYAQYIKIQDASPLSSTRFSGTADGFDIDAVVVLNNGCGNTASRSAELDNISTADETPVMEAYPNPMAEETSIRFGNVQTETDIRIELFDASGRLVLSQNARIDAEQNVVIIPTANIAKGMYHLVVNTGNESFRERLVK